jgi:hypothetical protein
MPITDAHHHRTVPDGGNDGGQDAWIAESRLQQRDPHVARVGEHSRQPVQRERAQTPWKQENGHDEGEDEGGELRTAKCEEKRPVQDVRDVHARHRDHEQGGQGDVIDEAVERVGAGLAEQPEPPA